MGEVQPALNAHTRAAEETTEQRVALDSAIKRTLIAGSFVVLLTAGLFSYIILGALASYTRPHYGTEHDDDKTRASDYSLGPQTPPRHPTPGTDPTTPTDGTTPSKESLEISEWTETTAAGERIRRSLSSPLMSLAGTSRLEEDPAGELCGQLDALSLSRRNCPSVLRCQLSLCELYFASWGPEGQRQFLHTLAQRDGPFVARFLGSLAQREPLLAQALAP
ncbi:hypothetical protein MTO96_029420 [Rhipicephalus appendiculatus]